GQVDGVHVEFTGVVGPQPPKNHYQQVVISIGQDPARDGGPVDLAQHISAIDKMVPIYEDSAEAMMSPRPRPVGIQSLDGRVRLLGAAAFSARRAVLTESDLEQFDQAYEEFLDTLPPETRVPIGITVAGVLIHRANQHGVAQCVVNINTDSFDELSALDEDFEQVAMEIIQYRTSEDHPQGFTTVDELTQL